jgi:indoleacetamide hydrolase
LSEKVIFPVALHEPIADIAKYLEDSGATGITVTSIIDQIASPDVKKTFEVVLADAMAAAYPDAVNVYRPQLQRMYSAYFADNSLDALVFPTSPVLPAPIDPVNGTGTLSIDGGPPVDTFTTTIRNMGPGSSAGVPSLSLPAGMSAGGLPVGLNLEGPIDGDSTILAIGMAIESLLGPLPAPEL